MTSEACLRTEFTVLLDPAFFLPTRQQFRDLSVLAELNRIMLALARRRAPACAVRMYTLDSTRTPRQLSDLNEIAFLLSAEEAYDARSLEAGGLSVDADVVCRPTALIEDQVVVERHLPILDAQQTVHEVCVFLRGHGLPWDRKQGVVPFGVLYSVSEPTLRRLQALHTVVSQRLPDERLHELARSLAYNRAVNICFTRDRLLFYRLQRRTAARVQPGELHYPLEVGYFLSHYYLLIFGAFDQTCRLAAGAFNTGLDSEQDWFKIGVKKPEFLNAINRNAPAVHNVLIDRNFLDWYDILAAARHFVAHQGQASSTPLLRRPVQEPSDDDLDRLLATEPGLNKLPNNLRAEIAEEFRSVMRFELRVRTYEQVSDDVMMIRRGEETLMIRPLANVEKDFDNFHVFVDKFVTAAEATLC